MEMTFKVATLKDRVQANREKHAQIAEEARRGYMEVVSNWLAQCTKVAEEGKIPNMLFNYPKPEDHTDEYDRLIDMLGMCEETEIVLTDRQFGQFVRDEWTWKRDFLESNSFYSQTAATELV